MQVLGVLLLLSLAVYASTLSKALTFLGCLFKCPVWNDTSTLFPEVATKTIIPKNERYPVKYCKARAKLGDKVFGVCKHTCLNGNRLHLVLPYEELDNRKPSKCHKKIKIYSFVGELFEKERRSISRKRQYIPNQIPNQKEMNFRNLFENDGFELQYKTSDVVQYWSCQGENRDYKKMYRNPYKPKYGKYCGLCTDRENEDEGPGQHIGAVIAADGIYKITGWTRLLYYKSKAEAAEIELWVKWRTKESDIDEKKLLAKRNKWINNDGWIFWSSQFHLPADTNYRFVFVYLKGPKRHIDIFIDGMILELLPHSNNWKNLLDEKIKDTRKRDVTIRVMFDEHHYTKKDFFKTKLEITQTSSEFGFGAAVHYKALKTNPDYRAFLSKNFEWATMESALKWENMDKTQGMSNHEKTDEMARLLINDMGMSVRGHCIFWDSADHIPKWLPSLKNETLQIALKKRMINLVLRYKNRFRHWDVNNEMLQDSFFVEKLGQSIRKWMFNGVHELDPSTKLFVNELDVFAAPFLTQAYLELILQLLKENVPVHGIGVQGHFTHAAHPEIIQERLDILSQAGLPIWITELDIKERDEERRADILETVMRVAFAHPSVIGITLWSFWDKHSWRGNNTSLFEGDNFQPNKVGKRFLNLRKQWRTRPTTLETQRVLNNGSLFNFKTYHGAHLLRIIFPDGQAIQKQIYVANHPKQLLIDLKAHVRGS